MSSTNFIKLNNYYQLVQEDNISETDSTKRGIIYIYPPENGTSIAKYGTGTQGETLATAPYLGGGSGADGLIYKETTTTETINVTSPYEYFTNGATIAYGDGALVCQGGDSGPLTFYSKDNGQTWTRGELDASHATKIVFGNGVFVGTNGGSGILYSTDMGVTWTSNNINQLSSIQGIAFGDGKFIAVSDMGGAWSTDGITWSNFEAYGYHVAIGNSRVIITDTTGMYSVYSLDGNSIASSELIPGMDPINGIKFINNQFVCYGNIIATSSNGENWVTSSIPDDSVTDVHYINDKLLAFIGSNALYWSSDDNGNTWSEESYLASGYNTITTADNILFGLRDEAGAYVLQASVDGSVWGDTIPVTKLSAYLEQADTDVTSKVAKLVGGNGGGSSSGETYTVSVKTSGAQSGTYLKDSTGNEQKILNLYNITTTGSESSITNGRLTGNPGTGIKYSQVFGNGHTIGNNLTSSLIRGQNHKIGADVNHVDVSGLKNTLANGADYNTIHGTEFNVTGTHNVTFGVGGKCAINGKANMMAGDLTGSTITGNYNTILCGGGQNSLTGTTNDPCQHNVVLGSTTTLTSAENCLTLGRLNTINNHDRAVLMGIGLTATRDNQLIVGSYNDETKTGGAFVVGNGTADSHSNAMIVYKEGTVTIGHDPIGPMDVVTKHYLEDVLLNGTW